MCSLSSMGHNIKEPTDFYLDFERYVLKSTTARPLKFVQASNGMIQDLA